MRKDTCVRICSAVGICTLSLQLPLCVPSLTRDMSNNMSKVTKVVILSKLLMATNCFIHYLKSNCDIEVGCPAFISLFLN